MDLLNKTTVQGKDDLLMQSLINFYKNKKIYPIFFLL